MMVRLATLALATILGIGVGSSGPAAAQDRNMVVVELFTSQGCSSCPPADALLSDLSERDDVLALALHVDYWDYLGWKDEFASPAFSHRQKRYAQVAGRRMVYTPQMIVSGSGTVVGTHPMDIAEMIAMELQRDVDVAMSIRKTAPRRFAVSLRSEGAKGPYLIQLVHYEPFRKVSIRKGENAGSEIGYSNIVTHWKVVGEWDGRAPLDMTVEAISDDPGAVLVQKEGPGLIEAAVRLP